MEPFTISCTTCQARLRVRDVSAIGQILTCPKCGSMVLVEAPPLPSSPTNPASPKSAKGSAAAKPAGHRPPPRPASPPSQAPLRNAADTVDDPTHYGTIKSAARAGESLRPETKASETNTQETKTRETKTRETKTGETEPADTELSEAALGGGESAAAEESSSPAPPWDELPDPAWLSEASRQRRRWLLVGLATAAGVCLAMGVFVVLVGRNPPSVARIGTSDPSGPSIADPGTSSTPASSPGSAEIPGGQEAAVVESPLAPPVVNTNREPGAESTVPTVPAVPAVSESPVEPVVPPNKVPAPKPDLSTVTEEKKDPPEPPDLVAPQVNPAIAKADRMTPGGGLAETLRKLGGLLDDSGATENTENPTASPTADPPDSKPPGDEPAPASPATAEIAKTAKPAPRVVDVAARLADPIQEIQINMPLQDFLQFVTTYSTIAITLDPDVLMFLKLTPDTLVEVRMSETTVEGLLESVLPKLGLVAVPVENQLLVTRATIGDGSPRAARRPIDDLMNNDPAQGDLLVSWVKSLVAPTAWAGAGGEGAASIADGWLELQQIDSVVLEVSAFLERLRVARGLPKKSTFDDRLFQPISRTARATPALSKRITVNYPRPTSFVRIVRRLAKESSTAIVINWQSLERSGWNPDAETTLSANDQTLGDALTALLQPMGLAYRVVDETTIQITTIDDLDGRQELELYPTVSLLEGGLDADSLQRRIRESLPTEWFEDEAGVLAFDPASRCLLVLLPQPRQQSLEKLLLSWKPTDK